MNKVISQTRIKEQHDKKPYIITTPTYRVGDKVYLEQLAPRARTENVMTHKPYQGPYFITAIVGQNETATTGPQ